MSDVRFDAEGFFYSDLDHARYQRVYEALVDHGRSVALLSPLSAPVEHYGKRLLAALRRRPDVILETYSPGGAEALIERMNKLLEPFSLDEARGASGEGRGSLHVMVLHELEGLEDDEAMLLARLAQDLPGVKVALLFLGYRRARLPEVLERYPNAQVRWVQEEPANQGAWSFIAMNAPAMVNRAIEGITRLSSSSPAVGTHQRHVAEQQAVVAQAFA